MAETASQLVTLDAFFAYDDGTDRRYELHDGAIVAMAPVTDRHGVLVIRTAVAIAGGLRPPCDVMTEAGIIPPTRLNTWYKADLVVSCSPATGDQFARDARVIVEVLSPSTVATDRGRKRDDYLLIPTLQDLLLVSSMERRIEHLRHGDDWALSVHPDDGDQIRLEAFPIVIDLGQLYDGILAA